MFCEILVTDITNISREISVYMKVTNISQTNISCSMPMQFLDKRIKFIFVRDKWIELEFLG